MEERGRGEPIGEAAILEVRDPHRATGARRVDKARLRELNLPLLAPVWEGQRYVPQGYALRVPADARPTAEALHDLRPAERFSGQMRTQAYKVRRGDTLGSIAKKKLGKTSRWKDIVAANGSDLSDPAALSPGMSIQLPKTN